MALTSFNLAGGALSDDLSAKAIIQEMSISPYAEAATALRNILSRSPSHFTTPQALVALAGKYCNDVHRKIMFYIHVFTTKLLSYSLYN